MIGFASCLASFGQGFLNFSDSSTTAVYDGFSNPGTFAKSPANVMVALMFSTDTTLNPLFGANGTSTTASASVSWSQVTADPNYHIATVSSANLTAITRTGLTLGTFSGGVVGLDGTAVGQTIRLYVVGWNSSAGSAGFGSALDLGWSNPFNITLTASSGGPSSLNAAGMTAFGVDPTPEPTSFALAGLGSATMLIFRRRRSK